MRRSLPLLQVRPHVLAELGYLHSSDLLPLHSPPHTSGSPAQGSRLPRGAPVTGMQEPSLPSSAHASHWPVQAEEQHKPSAQKPLEHSLAAVHSLPLGLDRKS